MDPPGRRSETRCSFRGAVVSPTLRWRSVRAGSQRPSPLESARLVCARIQLCALVFIVEAHDQFTIADEIASDRALNDRDSGRSELLQEPQVESGETFRHQGEAR